MSGMLFEPFFEQTATSLVDAFVTRARALEP
jgi:ribosome-associated toxin RatA of RatAB toxin-antitoxin module